jgi:hypothetical protein
MEDIRKQVAALFGTTPTSEEEYISLGMLDAPAKKSRCPYLSLIVIECNIGGYAHVGCTDPNFHSHCIFRLAHEKKDKGTR